jgi:glutamyl-tRNA synthetase
MKIIEDRGLAEKAVSKVSVSDIVQFMRYGFAKKITNNEFIYVHD